MEDALRELARKLERLFGINRLNPYSDGRGSKSWAKTVFPVDPATS